MFPSLLNITSCFIVNNDIEYLTVDSKGVPLLTKDCIELIEEFDRCFDFEGIIKKYPGMIHIYIKILNCEINWHRAIEFASETGDIQILNFIISQAKVKEQIKVNWNDCLIGAAESGNIELVQFIFEQKCKELTDLDWEDVMFNITNSEINKGNSSVEMAKFIIKQNSLADYNWFIGFCNAARNGNLEMVKFIIEKVREKDRGHRFDWEHGMHCAATSGDILLVEFMIKQGNKSDPNYSFNWDPAFNNAAVSGNVDLVEFIFKQAGPNHQFNWNNGLCCATKSGNISMVNFIIEKALQRQQGQQNPEYKFVWKTIGMYNAIESGNIEMVRFMIEQASIKDLFNFRWDYALFDAIMSGNLELVCLILASSVEDISYQFDDHQIIYWANLKGNVKIIKFLLKYFNLEEKIKIKIGVNRFNKN